MIRCLIAAVCLLAPTIALADDWPMGGRTASRNPVSLEKNPPTDWEAGDDNTKPRNVKWSAKVGRQSMGGPVVANGLVWVGTNNQNPLDPKIEGDYAVLACFREKDGKFLYQYLSPRIENAEISLDWPLQGISGCPLVDKNRIFFCTNRGELVCLDIGALQENGGKPNVVWKLDMRTEFGVFPRKQMIPGHDSFGSPASYKEFLYVPTGNGVGEDGKTVVAPDAPSLICVRKDTGKVVWKDSSPGKGLLFGQYASPLAVEIDGKCQVIAPQGDGWVRSFEAETGKLLWKFDSNRKGVPWNYGQRQDGNDTKVYVLATPVYAEGRVFFAAGIYPEAIGEQGRLFCVNPTKRGDISIELEDDGTGKGKPSPNSGLVWEFAGDPKNDKECMHLTLSSVAVHRGLVVATDRQGVIHCLDSKTGQRHWMHFSNDSFRGNPLIIDETIYVVDNSGEVSILQLSKNKKIIGKLVTGLAMYASPVFANGTLYLLTDSHLYAIGGK